MLAQRIPGIYRNALLLHFSTEMHSLSTALLTFTFYFSLPWPEPAGPNRVTKVLRVLLDESRVVHPPGSESALHLLLRRLPNLSGGHSTWQRGGVEGRHVIVIEIQIHLSLALLSLIIEIEFWRRVEPGESRPVEVPGTGVLKINLAVLLLQQRLERVYPGQGEVLVVNIRQPVEHVVELRRAR